MTFNRGDLVRNGAGMHGLVLREPLYTEPGRRHAVFLVAQGNRLVVEYLPSQLELIPLPGSERTANFAEWLQPLARLAALTYHVPHEG